MSLARLLAPLTPLYALGLALKNRRYDLDPSLAQRLGWPVVSVGNLSAGGAGKTPVVMRLAEMLRDEQVAVDVLSRGYGRSSTSVERVDPAGEAVRFGDEPLLIAATARVPVYVGASRYAAGRLAEQQAAGQGSATGDGSGFLPEAVPEAGLESSLESSLGSSLRSSLGSSMGTTPGLVAGLHLLDDGFQHRQLARSLDVVVLHASDFTGSLLPAGRLREPLAALARAHVLVLREEDEALAGKLNALGFEQPRWWIRRELQLPEPCREGAPVVAFCGIARPQEFFSSLRQQGAHLAAELAFPDHHRWSEADLERLIQLLRQRRAQGFLTTEKDAIRLTARQRTRLEAAAPLWTAGLRVHFLAEEPVRMQLLGLVGRR